MAPVDDTDETGPDVGGSDADSRSTDDGQQPDTAGVDGDQQQDAAGPTTDGTGRREVEVPQSLYKIVTVFSTLLSVLFVVVGFSVMDMATTVVSNPPGSVVVQALSVVVPMGALTANSSALALVVGLVGLGLVAAGAGTYVYGSRFRAPGMGKPKDEADEPSGDG